MHPIAPPVLYSGLDLGQMDEFSAFCAAERAEYREGGQRVFRYAIRQLPRWPLRTPYAAITADVARLLARPPLTGSVLTVDRTGVGAAVYELLAAARPAAKLVPITVTGGAHVTYDHGLTVPKRDLAGVLQVLLGARRLKVSPALPLAAVLGEELATFKAKINVATGAESFEAWREKDHDDLVLAAALPLWYGERHLPTGPFEMPPFIPGYRDPNALPDPATAPFMDAAGNRRRTGCLPPGCEPPRQPWGGFG